jgi:hypothetical protein
MKKYFLTLVIFGLLCSCDKESGRSNNNPYLPNYSFSAILNLNLPGYSGLNSNLNPTQITVDGDIDIVMMKISSNEYRAWNGNCPNQSPTACSRLSISGLNAKCNCEDAYEYNMFNGIGNNGASYTMVPYRVEVLGNNSIRVYN